MSEVLCHPGIDLGFSPAVTVVADLDGKREITILLPLVDCAACYRQSSANVAGRDELWLILMSKPLEFGSTRFNGFDQQVDCMILLINGIVRLVNGISG